MITSFAGFLDALKAKEVAILAEQNIKHAPTIGDMYEGLTKELLEKVIPADLGVRIVDGFILGPDGQPGNQIDAMLVMGDKGTPIPKTTKWQWPIEDVLAVFEVKKNLYGAELADSMDKMRVVSQQQQAYLLATKQNVPVDTSVRAFARVMGRFPHAGEIDDLSSASGEILRTIAFEQLAPVRVVFGYEGYAGEHGLRQAFLEYLEKYSNGGVAGPAVLPNLIICRDNSLLKMTGHPYVSPIGTDGRWGLVGSERHAPLRILIELLWTRLSNQFEQAFPMDDSLSEEAIARLLDGEFVLLNGARGWKLYATEISKEELADVKAAVWSPAELTIDEFKLVIMAMNHGGLSFEDKVLIEAAEAYKIDLKAFADTLIEKRLFAFVSPNLLHPIGDQIHQVMMPNGKIWAAMNGDMLQLWVAEQIKLKNAAKNA